jgi:hypothetical protein
MKPLISLRLKTGGRLSRVVGRVSIIVRDRCGSGSIWIDLVLISVRLILGGTTETVVKIIIGYDFV